jgi:hypothetical protein
MTAVHTCQLSVKPLSHKCFTPLNPPDGLGGKKNLVPSPIHRGGLGWGKTYVGQAFKLKLTPMTAVRPYR